jgi:hypothetical protein
MAYYPDGAQEDQVELSYLLILYVFSSSKLKQSGLAEYVDLFLAMVYDKPKQHSTLEFYRQSLNTGILLIVILSICLFVRSFVFVCLVGCLVVFICLKFCLFVCLFISCLFS